MRSSITVRSYMKDIVREWVEKAEADFMTATREKSARTNRVNHDIVCFLSQQCVEKYLKGFLQEHEISFDRTHDLVALLTLAPPVAPLWESWRSGFRRLSSYAVEFRYPGEWADTNQSRTAFEIASSFRMEARTVLDLPNN
jgi:HEPN domain-containing protein